MNRSKLGKKNNQNKQQVDKEKNAREKAVDILVKLEEKKGFSNLLLQHELKNSGLDVRDRGLVTEIVYGTMQRLNTIDYILQSFLNKRKINQLDSWLRQLLRIAVYQVRYLDKIPDRAVVFEAVEIAKILGHEGIAAFVNGVIRNVIRNPDLPNIPRWEENKIQHVSLTYSVPSWLVEKWFREFTEETVIQLLETINESAPFTVRHNSLKSDAEAFEGQLNQTGLKWDKSNHVQGAYHLQDIGDVSKDALFNEGLFTIQDESSMLVAQVIDPFPTAKILDACSAPGGKTTHIAELQGDKGQIIANDLHPHKIKLIEALSKKLGIKSIQTHSSDFLHYSDLSQFDYVLLDAPCSGLGVIRKKPELKWRMKQETIDSLIALQKLLIRHAATFVKPGGALIYSTCTINKNENSDVVEEFLADFPDYQGIDIQTNLPEVLHSHMNNKYSIQVLPQHMNSDGFFIAKLKRNG